jgi:hypothetical protein
MPFSIKDFTQEHCEQWKLNKLRNPKNPKNPQTNYRIEEGSKVYKLIESHCDAIGKNTPVVILPIVKSKKTVEWTQANCEQWEINKTTNPEMPINPISLRKVSSKSASYKKINQQCSKFTKGSKSPNIKSSKDSRTKNLLSRKLSLQDCLQWMKNKTKNPVNGYTLGENSKILKAIQKECKPLIDLYNTNAVVDTPIFTIDLNTQTSVTGLNAYDDYYGSFSYEIELLATKNQASSATGLSVTKHAYSKNYKLSFNKEEIDPSISFTSTGVIR